MLLIIFILLTSIFFTLYITFVAGRLKGLPKDNIEVLFSIILEIVFLSLFILSLLGIIYSYNK